MALDFEALLDAVESHALTLGRFRQVNTHEARNAPGQGLTAAIWLQDFTPVARTSGLAATSGRLEFTVRVYQPETLTPPDAIDPRVVTAVAELVAAYSEDFTLDGRAMAVDLLGAHGPPLGFRAGYLVMADTPLRIVDIRLPIIVTDIWEQSP